jgi:ABC-type antimicrobial peptide transport system permease subunit
MHVAPLLGLPKLIVRSEPGVGKKLESLVAAIDPNLMFAARPLSADVRETLNVAVAGASIAGSLGAIALLLAIVGVYGMFSYLVEERRREIGVRLALGASRPQLGRALARAMRWALGLGLAGALVSMLTAGQLLRGFIFGMSPVDPMSYLVVGLILGVAAIVATAAPVRRALRIDPAVTLKND